jgi:hypothetical protein
VSASSRVRGAAALTLTPVLLVALASCGGSSSSKPSPSAPTVAASTEPPFVEPFDNNDNDWPLRADSDGTKLAITNGQYQVTLPAGSIRYIRPAALAQRSDVQHDVSMSAAVTVLDGTTFALGLACRINPLDKQYYLGRVFENGTTAVVRRAKGSGEQMLGSGQTTPIRPDPKTPIRLALTCGQKDGKVQLAFRVNDQPAGQAEDPAPLPDNPPGIYAVAGLTTRFATFGFDDVRVAPGQP